MYASASNATTTPISIKWEQLTLTEKPDTTTLEEMMVKLDLLLLALKSLTGMGADAFLRVATQLHLESMVTERLSLIGEGGVDLARGKGRWAEEIDVAQGTGKSAGEIEAEGESFLSPPETTREKHQSSAHSSWADKRKDVSKLDEARSLVLIISHLAKQNQPLIRRAVALLEQIASQNTELQTITLLKTYIDNFNLIYQNYYASKTNSDVLKYSDNLSESTKQQLALRLLIDLLFYSDFNGHHRLWSISLKSNDLDR